MTPFDVLWLMAVAGVSLVASWHDQPTGWYDGRCTLMEEGLNLSSQVAMFVTPPQNGTLQEVARGKTTYTCIPWPGNYGKFAVDGIVADSSMSESAYNFLFAWWVVDLGQTRVINHLNIHTRQGCCSQRFHDIEIRVGSTLEISGNFSSYTMFSTYKGPYTVDQGGLNCFRNDGVVGRFISIQRVTPEAGDHLQLVEVFVWAQN